MKAAHVFPPVLLAGCFFSITALAGNGQSNNAESSDWRQILSARLPVLGHRNWIVIADSAYPQQSEAGIQTIYADADQMQVLEHTFRLLGQSKHVTPTVFLDQELDFLPESDAPGITDYRDTLKSLIAERQIVRKPHEQIMAELGQTSRQFSVLIIKTRSVLPYTTVFLRLDCAYWPADAEERLRRAMQQKPSR